VSTFDGASTRNITRRVRSPSHPKKQLRQNATKSRRSSQAPQPLTTPPQNHKNACSISDSRADGVYFFFNLPLQTITNQLHRVTNLRPTDAEDTPFYYTFKVQCTSCREIHPNWVSISRFEQNEQSGSRGEANFVWRCKNCKVRPPQS
jgi:hypothetical protein